MYSSITANDKMNSYYMSLKIEIIALVFDRNYRLFIRSGFSSQLLDNYWLTNNSQRMYEIL